MGIPYSLVAAEGQKRIIKSLVEEKSLQISPFPVTQGTVSSRQVMVICKAGVPRTMLLSESFVEPVIFKSESASNLVTHASLVRISWSL